MIGVRALVGSVLALVFASALAVCAAAAPARTLEEARALFDQGNRLYQGEDFAGARQAYEDMVEGGWLSAAVYFNLGNAALKTQDLGRAIWAFARAERLAPGDADVRANLAYARARTRDTVASEDESQFLKGLAAASSRWPTRLLLRAGIALYWVLAAALVVQLLVPALQKPMRSFAWGAGALLIIAAIATGLRAFGESGASAVVLPTELAAQSGPGDDGHAVFTLHAGTEVRVSRALGGWVEISLGPDLKGWVPESALARI